MCFHGPMAGHPRVRCAGTPRWSIVMDDSDTMVWGSGSDYILGACCV